MKVGDLVKLNIHSHFAQGITDIIGVPYHAIGIVLRSECDVYSVLFPMLANETRSFIEQDLEVVSESQ